MKIHWGTLAIGAGIGALIGAYYAAKGASVVLASELQNAYVLGQTNPTLAYAQLTPAQQALLLTTPAMVSPPGVSVGSTSTLSGGTVQGAGTGVSGSTNAAPVVTGAGTSGYAAGAFGNVIRRV